MIRLLTLSIILISCFFNFAHAKIQVADISPNVFEEAYKDISGLHLDTNGISGFFPYGMLALMNKTEKLKLVEGKHHYSLLQGRKLKAQYQIPDANNAYGWGALTSLVIQNAQSLSPKLRQYDNEQIYEIFFDGIMKNLDKFSRYRSKAESTGYLDHGVENKCRHLGIVFTLQNGEYRAQHVQTSSPAYEIGIRSNDTIHSINKVQIKNLPVQDVYRKLCGGPEKKIEILYENDRGDLLTEYLSRKVLLKPSVKFHMNKNILFIKLTRFSPLTDRELEIVFNKVNNYPVKGIVLDLRQNRGGLLDQAVKVSDAFLDQGLILKTQGKHRASNQTFYATHETLISPETPMIILIDNYTASSAEIVTEALKDHNRGIIIGKRSYGKGLVQAVTKLPNEGQLYLTWSRIISPSGDSFNKFGIKPLYCYNNPNQQLCKNIYYRYATSPMDMSYYILNNPDVYNSLLSHQAKANKALHE